MLPTGTGKTVVFAELAREVCAALAKRVLVLAHRTELLEQAQRKLADVGCYSRLEKAGSRAGAAQVVVASVQTLQGKRLANFLALGFGLVVVDEGHHGVATSYQNILGHFAGVPTLFVTATADRADGKGLEEVCSSVAYQYDLRAAIRDRWLVPIRARRIVVDGLDLSSVHTRAGDLDAKELGEIMRAEEHIHGVVDPLRREAGDRKTIVFAVDVAHAHQLAAALNRHREGCALAVDGSASDTERKAALALFAVGAIQFLVNCALFTEGFDEPSVSCVAIARPTKSRSLYTQMVGRGTRLLGSSWERSLVAGKRDCLVLDFVGNSGRHKLIGPLDALAGNEELAAEVRAEAEARLAAEQGELEDVLAKSAEEVDRHRNRASVIATAHYRARDIDPFLGDFLDKVDTSADLTPANSQQLEQLKLHGFKRLPPQLSMAEAERWLRAIAKRRKAGLSTFKQVRVLGRFGIDAKRWTLGAASAKLDELARNGWKREAGVP